MLECGNVQTLSRRTKTLRPLEQRLDVSDFSPQLGTKERELQVALQKQERYQSTVQDVTARMERVQQKLIGVNFNPYKDMDRQMKDHRVSIEIACWEMFHDFFVVS